MDIQTETTPADTTLDSQEEVLVDADGDIVVEGDFASPVTTADAASENLADALLSSADLLSLIHI